MSQTNVANLGGPVGFVDVRHPSVSPPVCEQAQIVKSKDIDVCPMNKVVCQDADVAAGVARSDDSNAWWIIAFQRRDELLRPATRQHLRVVVDAVKVVGIVEIRIQHCVILGPGWFPSMIALHQRGQVSNDALQDPDVVAAWNCLRNASLSF